MTVALRLRYRFAGAHVHCRLFTAPADVPMPTWANCGTLVFRLDEWYSVRVTLSALMELIEE